MGTMFISQDDFEDFMTECDTDPDLRTVQRQLDTAQSLGSFVAAAERHGYTGPRGPETDEHWTERLDRELERQLERQAPTPYRDDAGHGWAGRTARS